MKSRTDREREREKRKRGNMTERIDSNFVVNVIQTLL